MGIRRFWRAISNRNIARDVDKLTAIDYKILNQYTVLVSGVFLIDAFRDLYFGNTIDFFVLFVLGIGLLLWFLFVPIKVRALPVLLYIIFIVCILLVFYFSCRAGFNSGLTAYYWGLLFMTLYTFGERKLILYCVSIFVLVFVLFYIGHHYDFALFNMNDTPVSEKLRKNHRLVTFIQILVLLGFYGYFVNQKNRMTVRLYEEAIKSKNIISDLNRRLESSGCKSQIEDVVKLAMEDDIAFVPKFKLVFPDFYTNLLQINPNMTTDEFKTCSLLKLGFTTKDIAEYCNLAVRSVQTKKNRLRKSFDIPSDEDLYCWIEKIETCKPTVEAPF
ncbi:MULTISPECIES: helix-turn-helix transcriptional regulator [Sphingobacterium]|uniref:helix-turn-helix transcriptional regulator n=1 Tax=Sphingobacterium TaxID=28453 RepID=UPI001969CBA8|nr:MULTISPECIES: diguanylate cyclase [unclassified Sphingobacterium]